MKKILVIGGSGLLGSTIMQVLAKNFAVHGTFYSNFSPGLIYLDIVDRNSIKKIFDEIKPDIVINTVALADPDYCEIHPDKAKAINYVGTKNIVSVCKLTGCKLIHISTSYVFDGQKPNYSENDQATPINIYGKTKKEAENEAKKLKNSVIIRFDLLYGYNGIDGPNGYIGKLLTGRRSEVDAIRKKQPIWTEDIARAVEIIIKDKRKGIVHLGSPDLKDKYRFGRLFEKKLGRKKRIILSKNKKYVAKRPINSSLDIKLAKSWGIRFTKTERAIEKIVAQIRSDGIKDKTTFCQVCGKQMLWDKKGKDSFYKCTKCGFVYYPKAVPAVAAIIKRDKKILLVKRSNEPHKGEWTIPSGFVDYNEDAEKALIREMKEEINILPKKYYIFDLRVGKEDPDKHIFGIYYVVTSYKGKAQCVSPENSEFGWFNINDLPQIAFKANRHVLKNYIATLKSD